MKRLIYAVIAASALGLTAGGFAVAADNDTHGGAVIQSPMSGQGTLGQEDEEKKPADEETSKPDEQK